MRRFSRIYLVVLLMLLPVLFIASWIGSIYDSHILNLLDADGIRWGVTHVLSNYGSLPLSLIIFLLVVVSVAIESGWLAWLYPKNHPLMLKQLRAYTYTNLVGMVSLVAVALVLLMPSSPLLNAFGGFAHSPLQRGGGVLLLMLILLMSNIYGYLSGQLTTNSDFIFAHTRLLRKYSYVFITLFVVAQVYGCLEYSHLLNFANPLLDDIVMYILIILCFVG